jgi:hypothetical protein
MAQQMNFGGLFKAFEAVITFSDAARRFTGGTPAPESTSIAATAAGSGLAAQIEARLTNVVVAALKEAFERDHARLELERTQFEEQRRRAEEATRMEIRRQAADRELGRLRLLAGTALVGWIASVVVLVVRVATMTTVARAVVIVGWVLLLGALGAAFSAQSRVAAPVADNRDAPDAGRAGAIAMWLLIAGLGVSGLSVLL